MNEPQIYERIAATGALTGLIYTVHRLGFFRIIGEWWSRPSETTRQSVALEKIAETVSRMGLAMNDVSANLQRISDNFVVAEAMTRMLADRDPTPMFQCELPSGLCVWSNRALQNLFGLTREQMKGSGWAEAIVPSHQDRVLHHWKNAVVNSDIYNCDYPIENNGKLINVRAHAEFVRDASGRKVVAIGTIKLMPLIAGHDEEEAA